VDRQPKGKRNTQPLTSAIEALHRRCGVYTKPAIVRRILDSVGWKDDADLSEARLLEPACGDGAFVVEAARRLATAFRRRNVALTAPNLLNRITAFELHPREARRARERVVETLHAAGVHHRTAAVCARSWIIEGDFLLTDLPSAHYTHAVGNPPYVRWSRIPKALKHLYDKHLSGTVLGGDLFLPFLDRALEATLQTGRCGFICSDRWRYMAFAESFRQKWLPKLKIHSERSIHSTEAFVDDVDSYPTILIASKLSSVAAKAPAVITGRKGETLSELGCTVKVGPALGHTPAYVLDPKENDVERNLLLPWLDGSEIEAGVITWSGRRVIVMYGSNGKLIDLERFPRLRKRMECFRAQLERRSIVANGAPWYRPIDRVCAADWSRPKLLVPEIAKIPRVAIDRSGAIPSHGVYAIFAPDDDVEAIYVRLENGRLAEALDSIAPRVKGGYVRCYKRFLLMARF
jgi:adenine-specific DNA-methyltransferase